ncbi:hypothetical protein B566_EDAN002394, partial [Ephemera danica]
MAISSSSTEQEQSASLSMNMSRSVTVVDSIEIAEITEAEGERGVAAALTYCKTRVLIPYLRLLSVVGLRPLLSNASGQWPTMLTSCIGRFYLVLMLGVFILGYILQYLACFRRDRAPNLKRSENPETWELMQCPGSLLFNFVLPSILHLMSYLYALHLYRLRDSEQLQNLMERVFVVSCSNGEGIARPQQLARSLWFLIALAATWLVAVTLMSGLILLHNPPTFLWLERCEPRVLLTLQTLLFVGTLAQDTFLATLVSGYCLQAQLLAALAVALRQRLIQHSISILDWMREMKELGQLLSHLNRELGPAVCVVGVVCTWWAVSATGWLAGWTEEEPVAPTPGLSALPVLLWSLLTIAPFIQAAWLSGCCQAIRSVGHEVRTRPFVYQDAPTSELDSLLAALRQFVTTASLVVWFAGIRTRPLVHSDHPGACCLRVRPPCE